MVVRSIDVGRPGSPVWKQNHLIAVPSFIVYGPGGTVMLTGKAARDEIEESLHADMEE